MNYKNKIAFFVTVTLLLTFVITSFQKKEITITSSDSVLEVLAKLGDKMPLHFIPSAKLDSNKIQEGRNLITTGFSNPTEKKLFETKQSKHFVCTDCHNIQREDTDLNKSNPDTRLKYVY